MGDYSETVKFSRGTGAKTRNGHSHCTGLNVSDGIFHDTKRLSPVNSKDDWGAAWFEVPDEDLGLTCLALWPGLAEVIDMEKLAGRMGDPACARLAEKLLKEGT